MSVSLGPGCKKGWLSRQHTAQQGYCVGALPILLKFSGARVHVPHRPDEGHYEGKPIGSGWYGHGGGMMALEKEMTGFPEEMRLSASWELLQ